MLLPFLVLSVPVVGYLLAAVVSHLVGVFCEALSKFSAMHAGILALIFFLYQLAGFIDATEQTAPVKSSPTLLIIQTCSQGR